MVADRDRVGISWRPELAAHIVDAGDRIELFEIIPDDYLNAPRKTLDALKSLGREKRVMVHSVSQGLAQSRAVELRRLEKLARFVDIVQPSAWSEHLAFVRTPTIELEHLAAPPWTPEGVGCAVRNILTAARVVGSLPHMENISVFFEPPWSTMSEGEWVTKVIEKSGAGFLLDLNNIVTNAHNLRVDPRLYFLSMPICSVQWVHIAGGVEVRTKSDRTFLRDDHRHTVPEAVYELLEELAENVPHPLSVILEWDGDFPDFSEIFRDLDRAREAMKRGRLQALGPGGQDAVSA